MKQIKYLNDPLFARSVRYKNTPCYRTVLSHAFYHYHHFHRDIDELEKQIQFLIDCFYINEPYTLKSDVFGEEFTEIFLEMYPLPMGNELGYVIVDHSGGCFPLICYPNSQKKNYKRASRISGLEYVVKSLENNKDQLLKLIIKYVEERRDYKDFQVELHEFIYN